MIAKCEALCNFFAGSWLVRRLMVKNLILMK
jgi:hypothetical protein